MGCQLELPIGAVGVQSGMVRRSINMVLQLPQCDLNQLSATGGKDLAERIRKHTHAEHVTRVNVRKPVNESTD